MALTLAHIIAPQQPRCAPLSHYEEAQGGGQRSAGSIWRVWLPCFIHRTAQYLVFACMSKPSRGTLCVIGMHVAFALSTRPHPSHCFRSESVTWSLNAETTRNLGDTPSVLAEKQKSERREPALRSTERDMEVDGTEAETRQVKAEEEEVCAGKA